MSKITKILILSCLPIAVCFLLYVLNFGSNRFSARPIDWAHFSDFMSISIGLSCLVLIIIVVHRGNRELIENERFRNKPILIFKMSTKSVWEVKNVGNGPALDILISFRHGHNDWDTPAKVYSLTSGEEIKLDWILSADELLAQYHDINEMNIQSYCVHHSTKVITNEDDFVRLDTSIYRSWEETHPKFKN